MALVDDLVAAVEASSADDGKKKVAEAFLRGAGPVIESLGAEVFADVMRAVAGGSAAPPAVVGNLSQPEVVALLGATANEMSDLADQHAAELQARAAALEAMKQAALSVVAKVVIGVL